MSEPIKVLAFAGARDVVGAAEVEIQLDVASCTTTELMDRLCGRFPALAPYRSLIRVAVNGSYAAEDVDVRPGDEVALIPPVAGG